MTERTSLVCVALCLAASISWAASIHQAQELFLAGDLEAARTELQDLLARGDDDPARPGALRLLGQLEADQRNWRAALDAWSELTDRYALSSEATAVSPAIRPLQALVDCDCGAAATTEPTEVRAASSAAPPAAPTPVPGLFMVGGWGPEYDAAQEVTRGLIELLEENGVGVRAASTEIPAIRGAQATLSFLLEEARQAGVEGLIFMTCRFSHRDFIDVARYDLAGNQLWQERTTGGTALKPRHERGKPSPALVERARERLAKRIGTPDLPIQ